MALMSVRVGGLWNTVKNIYVRVAGTWQGVKQGYVRVNGNWQLFYSVGGGGGINHLYVGSSTGIINTNEIIPAGVSTMTIEVFGGGGLGGNSTDFAGNNQGGGGGSGGYARSVYNVATNAGQHINVVILNDGECIVTGGNAAFPISSMYMYCVYGSNGSQGTGLGNGAGGAGGAATGGNVANAFGNNGSAGVSAPAPLATNGAAPIVGVYHSGNKGIDGTRTSAYNNGGLPTVGIVNIHYE